jgi:adenylate kinase
LKVIMQPEYQGIVLFGPPGVGKGAQAGILSRSHGVPHLSTGDLIRDEIRHGTPLGLRVKEAVSRGAFADDETVLGIVMARIDRPEFRNGFVMDGFPRNVRQAQMLDDLLAERGLRVSSALFISAPDEVVLRRLAGRRVCSKCGETYHEDFKRSKTQGICDLCDGALKRRHDDDPSTHRERLVTYHRQTEPLVEYYERSGVLRRINGDQTIEKVAAEIAGVLSKVGSAR